MPYDPKIHHRKSIRLPHWDYSWGWWYYVTICTSNRECLFGEITNDTMILNDVGNIVEEEWLKTPTIRSNVELDDFVIMPNHVHGIIVLNDTPNTITNNKVLQQASVRATRRVAPTKESTTLKSNSLGSIVGQFKSVVSKRIRFGKLQEYRGSIWQRGYYEHIIRNDADLTRIRTYIANNPLQWAIDEENPTNIKS